MKKFLVCFVSTCLIIAVIICIIIASTKVKKAGNKGETIKICNVVNGYLGDKSFFDSAESGLAKLAQEGKIEYKTIQMGGTDADQPKWLNTLDEVSGSEEYDYIVCGSPQYADIIREIAEKYPKQKYIVYDTSIDLPNVVSITYAQNDMGYLIGIIAASYTQLNGVNNVNPDKVIGFVGGQDMDTINDFLYGYIEGARFVDPDTKIDAQYVGNFWDTATAKELTNVMIESYKCDVIWGVASAAGIGAAESTEEHDMWFIGVDSDQEQTFKDSQPEISKITITSGLKNVGDSLEYVINKIIAGEEHWGETLKLGIAENGVGFASEGNYKTLIPEDVQKKVEEARQKIVSGEIKVGTAFGTDDIIELRKSVSPRR